MPGYETKVESLALDGMADLVIRSLKDRQQFADADGAAERVGISSAMWPIFGLVWPSGRILTEHLATLELGQRRILELGCGLGLASLAMHRRGADVTASDIHPLAAAFFEANLALNALAAIPFFGGAWSLSAPELGRFDLLVGSDVLYDHSHAEELAAFIGRHANPTAEVIIVDPNRGHRSAFRRLMLAHDFAGAVVAAPMRRFEGALPFRGQILTFTRTAGAPRR